MSETQTPSNEDFLRDFVELQRKVADISNAAVGGAQLLPGDIVIGGSTRPGCLLCDGTLVSRTTEAGIFAVWGTTFGVGDGSTTFALPDMRGRIAAGANGSTFVLGTATGTETTTLTSAQSGMPAHTHPGGGAGTTGAGSAHSHTGTTGSNNADHTHTYNIPASIGSGSTPNNINAGSISNSQTTSGESTTHQHAFTTGTEAAHTHSFTDPTTGSAGGGSASTPHTNVQPSLPINFWIKS